MVMPGTHKETLFIDKDSTTLSGVIEHGKYPVLEDEGLHNDAVLYSGNAVMGQAGKNFIFRNNIIVYTGVYGVSSQPGKSGIVSYNIVSGVEDVAFYVQDIRYFVRGITPVAMIEQVMLYFRFRANWFARVKKSFIH
jgi:hypothetical protein